MFKKDTADYIVADLVSAVDRLRNLHDKLTMKIGKTGEEKAIARLSYILGDK